jgi:hypothetical protein
VAESIVRVIDQEASAFEREKARFDTPDALETMDRLDLWVDRARRHAVGPDEALRRLRIHWSRRRSADYHFRMLRVRRAGPAALSPSPPAAPAGP